MDEAVQVAINASMRPRHFAEEIFDERLGLSSGFAGFNEASAFRRGNPGHADHHPPDRREASMRPRHFAEEIGMIAVALDLGVGASMRPRHFAEEIQRPVRHDDHHHALQ